MTLFNINCLLKAISPNIVTLEVILNLGDTLNAGEIKSIAVFSIC